MKLWKAFLCAAWSILIACGVFIVIEAHKLIYQYAAETASATIYNDSSGTRTETVHVMTDVIPYTALVAAIVITAVIGFYIYMKPSLDQVTRLSRQ